MEIMSDNTGTRMREKNSQNQIVEIFFQKEIYSNFDYYCVGLRVGVKRRKNWNDINNISTGKAGIESLLIAKGMIAKFIEELEKSKTPTILAISWSNNRRRDVYARGLKDLGFKMGRIFGFKALYREFNK